MKVLLLVLVFFLNACDDTSSSSNNTSNNNNSNNTNNTNNINECAVGEFRCLGSLLQTCTEGVWVDDRICGTGDEPPLCVEESGQCLNCTTVSGACGEDGNIYECDSSGNPTTVRKECPEGEGCIIDKGLAVCDNACGKSISDRSYRGCEFYAVTLLNTRIEQVFNNNFAIAVSNSNDATTLLKVATDTVIHEIAIRPMSVEILLLPYINNLRMGMYDGAMWPFNSGIYPEQSYRIETDYPVTVYQFNPYDFEYSGVSSNSNDASLLLPASVFGTKYRVLTRGNSAIKRQTTNYSAEPGFTAVVAAYDNTSVTFSTTAWIASDGDGLVPETAPGGNVTVSLNKGDVLQLVGKSNLTYEDCAQLEPSELSGPDEELFEYCNPGPQYDFTGSIVTSDKPVGVFAGHNCGFVPFDYRACDHLEEMLMPESTWGKRFFIAQTHPVEPLTSETNVIRILAGGDAPVTVTWDLPGAEPRVIQPGEFFDIQPAAGYHFELNATGPVSVGKFTVGQKFWTDVQSSSGDPSFGLVVPTEQFRNEYSFVAPISMTVNYVNVVSRIPGPQDDLIVLDGNPITPEMYEEIGSGYGVARIELPVSGGAHKIFSTDGTTFFGIEVYGFANYTSYMYPGGLDLKVITVQ